MVACYDYGGVGCVDHMWLKELGEHQVEPLEGFLHLGRCPWKPVTNYIGMRES
jgi:hypothetical protein